MAAECALVEALPKLIHGTAIESNNDLSAGSYFSGRKPSDGLIDLSKSGVEVYNLIRAVAPPYYPGAFVMAGGFQLVIHGVKRRFDLQDSVLTKGLSVNDDKAYLRCEDGTVFEVLQASAANHLMKGAQLAQWIQQHA